VDEGLQGARKKVATMLVSFTEALEGRKVSPLGRLRAAGSWRAAAAEGDRDAAMKALMREAEDCGADAIVDVRFETDALAGSDIEGVPLSRLSASGLAVRFAA